STSHRPKRVSTAAACCTTTLSDPTSPVSGSAPGMASAAAASASASRSTSATCAPSAAKSPAAASPDPEAPPVTTAAGPASFMLSPPGGKAVTRGILYYVYNGHARVVSRLVLPARAYARAGGGAMSMAAADNKRQHAVDGA